MSNEQSAPAGMRAITKKSALPVYAIGLVWLLWALLFPLYSVLHYLICLAVSLAVFFLLNSLIPAQTVYEKIPDVKTGDEAADSLLKTGRGSLTAIETSAAGIQNEEVRGKIARLENTCGRIFDFVQHTPKSAAGLRKFMGYYLPTLQKLVDTYALMERQGVSGENITSAMARISAMLDTMDAAFKKQLDALFGDTALDVDTDITVMEGMMAQEGLTRDGGQMEL